MLTLEKAYQILNVSPDASDEEIKKAYRAKVKEMHPDTHPDDPLAEAKFQALQNAKTIIDEERKKQPASHSHTENQHQQSSENTDHSHGSNESNSKNTYGGANQSSGDSYTGQSQSSHQNTYSHDETPLSSSQKERAALAALYKFCVSDVNSSDYLLAQSNIKDSKDNSLIIVTCTWGILLRNLLEYVVKSHTISRLSGKAKLDKHLDELKSMNVYQEDIINFFYAIKKVTNKVAHIETEEDILFPQNLLSKYVNLSRTFQQFLDYFVKKNRCGTPYFYMLKTLHGAFVQKIEDLYQQRKNCYSPSEYIDIFITAKKSTNSTDKFVIPFSLAALSRRNLETGLTYKIMKPYGDYQSLFANIPLEKIPEKIERIAETSTSEAQLYTEINDIINGFLHLSYTDALENAKFFEKHPQQVYDNMYNRMTTVAEILISVLDDIFSDKKLKPRIHLKKLKGLTPIFQKPSLYSRCPKFIKALPWIFFWPILLCVKLLKSNTHGILKVIGTLVLIEAMYLMIMLGNFGYFVVREVFDEFTPTHNSSGNLNTGNNSTGNNSTIDNLIIDNLYQLKSNSTGYTIYVFAGAKNRMPENVVIPSEYKGIPITAIAEQGFANCDKITSVVVPESVTSIGVGAFKGCNKLQSITLPFIGKSEAAQNHEAVLGYIFGYERITKKVSSRPNYWVDTLYNEKPVDIVGQTWQVTFQDADSYNKEYFYYYIPDSLTSVTITKQDAVPAYAFNGCKNLKNIKYGESFASITAIGTAAFQNCENLLFDGKDDNILAFGYDITEISDYSFNGCSNIIKLEIPNTVRRIGLAAFQNCSQLEELIVPFIGETEDSINAEAVLGYIFGYECITKKVSSRPNYWVDTLYNEKPVDIVGQTWQVTFQDADSYNKEYFYYYIPDSLTSVTVTKQDAVPAYAFNGCKNLQSIKYNNSFKSIVSVGTAAFQDCENLLFDGENGSYLEFGNSITTIGDYAFSKCFNITTIVIPNNVRKIGFAAFMDCNNLKDLTIPFVGETEDSVNAESVLGYIFGYECIMKYVGTRPSYWVDTLYNEKPVAIEGQTWQLTFQASNSYDREYFYYYIPKSLTSVIVSKQTQIPAYAFNGCKNLTTVTIPAGSTIGEYAFQDCNAEIIEK